MGWNYRVLATEGEEDVYLQIHEVYYKDDKPISYTKNPISIGGEEIQNIKWVLNKIEECLEKPILWGDDRFPAEYKK